MVDEDCKLEIAISDRGVAEALKEELTELKEAGLIKEFTSTMKRHCDFCGRQINEDEEFTSIKVKDDDWLDKCEACSNG